MKKIGLASFLAAALQTTASAQCANSLATRTYDTSLSGSSFNMFNLSFPKWNPDSGLLVSVKLSSQVSSQYSFTLGNTDVASSTYTLSVGQQEQFSSPQLPSTYTGIYPPRLIGSYTLAPGQSISQGPFTFLDKYTTSDSITAVGPFLGTDQVSVSYMSFTFTTLSTYNNAYYYYGAQISNSMHFSLQYLYCNSSGGVLAANLARWTAVLQQPRSVQLDWSAANETAGRTYHIQRSPDGRSFSDIAALPARNDNDPDYSFSDVLPDGSSGSFYYRLLIDDQGSFSYSAVRQVSINADAAGIRVYPNPAADFIVVNPGSTGSWQVDILSASGSLIQQAAFQQTSSMRINFRSRMPAGTYFVRAADTKRNRSFTTSFIVAGH